jgi:hypothetical protein
MFHNHSEPSFYAGIAALYIFAMCTLVFAFWINAEKKIEKAWATRAGNAVFERCINRLETLSQTDLLNCIEQGQAEYDATRQALVANKK